MSFTVRLTEILWARLKTRSIKERRSMRAILIDALEAYLKGAKA